MTGFVPPALRLFALCVVLTVQPGCAYKIGAGVMDGILDSAAGRSPRAEGGGVTPIAEDLAERALLAELGHQLGQGLNEGALEVSEDQQLRLEVLIDSLLDVATSKAGQGIRRDVSPELRAMVKRDIVNALAEGMRNEVSLSLEQTMDRVVTRAVLALRRGLEDPKLEDALSDLLREAIQDAMLEDRVVSKDGESEVVRQAIKKTLRETVQQGVLDPTTGDVTKLVDVIAGKVQETSQRTEQVLQAIIGALVIILGVVGLAFYLSQRQLRRSREGQVQRESQLRTVDAAIAALDEQTRDSLLRNIGHTQNDLDD